MRVFRSASAVILIACLLLPLCLGGCTGEKAGETLLIPEELSLSPEELCYRDTVCYVDSQLLLTAEEGTKYTDIKALVRKAGGKIIGCIPFSGDYHIDFPRGKTWEELETLRGSWEEEDFVERVTLHRVFPSDERSPDYRKDSWNGDDNWNQQKPSGSNWWAEAVRLPEVWELDIWDDLPKGAPKLGIIDDSFDTNHEDLWSVFTELWYNTPQSGSHGTKMSGLIAAEMGNGIAIAGAASCAEPKLYGFSMDGLAGVKGRFADQYYSDITYKYAISLLLGKGVRAINISLGSDAMIYAAQYGEPERKAAALEHLEYFSESMTGFFRRALDAGYDFLIMKSGGNGSRKDWQKESLSEYPYGYYHHENTDPNGAICSARYDELGAITDPVVREHIVTVGAAEQANRKGTVYVRCDFSSTDCDVYAPGKNILSLDHSPEGVSSWQGTSQAAAIVTGIAGLVWAVNPELSAGQVKQLLTLSGGVRVLENNTFPAPEYSGETVPLVDAAYAVKAAMTLTGKGGSTGTLASVTGYLYTMEQDGQGNLEEVPRSGVTVTITGSDGTVTELESSKWGSFDVFLPQGEYILQADAEGCFPREQSFVLKEGRAVYLPLELEAVPLVTDAVHLHAPSYDEPSGILYSIPRVNLPEDLAAEVNGQILEELMDYVNPNRSDSRGMSYLWAKNGDILSILVLCGEDYNTAMSRFYVYNISLEAGTALENSRIWEACGLTREEYFEKLRNAVSASYSKTDINSFPEYYRTYCANQVKRSLSQENLEEALPYINGAGDLCVAIKVYSFAGPDYHWFLFNLTGRDEPLRPGYGSDSISRCDWVTDPADPYGRFIRSGCWKLYALDEQKAAGYAIVDIDGNGRDELILDTQGLSPEFHDHLVFTLTEDNEILIAARLYTYQCIAYSGEQKCLGYAYPRETAGGSYHCAHLDGNILYRTLTLHNDGGNYTVTDYGTDGKAVSTQPITPEAYQKIMGSFCGIDWQEMP